MRFLFFTLCILNFLVFIALYIWFPILRPVLDGEDMLIENLTVVLYLSASLLSVFCLFMFKKNKERKACVFAFILGLIAFLDELSFGERMFDLSMPYIGSQKIDTIHDIIKKIFTITRIIINRIPGYISVSVISAFLIALYVLGLKNKTRLSNFYTAILKSKPCYFLMLCAIQLVISTVIDFDIIYNDLLFLFEELLEMNAGLALVFSSIIVVREYLLNKKSDLELKIVSLPNSAEINCKADIFNNKIA